MKVVIRRVVSKDWEAIYLNDNITQIGHSVPIEYICEHLQKLIKDANESITEIDGEHYFINDKYVEEFDFPSNFKEIKEYMFE